MCNYVRSIDIGKMLRYFQSIHLGLSESWEEWPTRFMANAIKLSTGVVDRVKEEEEEESLEREG